MRVLTFMNHEIAGVLELTRPSFCGRLTLGVTTGGSQLVPFKPFSEGPLPWLTSERLDLKKIKRNAFYAFRFFYSLNF
jgi:hypothetical protein